MKKNYCLHCRTTVIAGTKQERSNLKNIPIGFVVMLIFKVYTDQ